MLCFEQSQLLFDFEVFLIDLEGDRFDLCLGFPKITFVKFSSIFSLTVAF